jgi:hypothetical protein
MEGVLVDVALVIVIETETNVVRTAPVGNDEVISRRALAAVQVAVAFVRNAFSRRVLTGARRLDALGARTVDAR